MTIMERTSYISGKVLLRTNTGCCPLVVRLMSACCPLLKRTTSGHQADNKRTTNGVGPCLARGRAGEGLRPLFIS